MTRVVVAVAALLVACGDDGEPRAAATSTTGGGGGAAPICGAWEAPSAAGCAPAGVPAEACAIGFDPDDSGGCEPLLPPAPCEAGTLVVPGDVACRPVAPCGDPPWGDVTPDATAQFVDASYPGADSDGSIDRPWTAIQPALAAAPSNGMVVVAAGTYAEDLAIGPGSVRLVGRCPDLVEVQGTGVQFATLVVTGGADGTELSSISVTGPNVGIAVSGSEDVLMDRIRVRDTGVRGIDVENAVGFAAATVRGSLVEGCGEAGIVALGAELTVEASVVRASIPGSTPGGSGSGLLVQDNTGQRGVAHVLGSVFEQNHDAGVSVISSDLDLEGTVVQDTLPGATGEGGWGISVIDFEGTGRSTAAIRSSVLRRNNEIGVVVIGSDATIETTVVREMQTSAPDEPDGLGVVYQDDIDTGERSAGAVRASLLDGCIQVGVHVMGSDVALESLIVRGTQVSANDIGISRGVNVSRNPMTNARAVVTLSGSVIADSVNGGVVVVDADATLFDLVVRNSVADASALYGDGIAVTTFVAPPATLSLSGARIEHNARAGVASFGSSVTVTGSTFECNPFELDGEPWEGFEFTFSDQGGNTCGCAGTAAPCKVQSADLVPPQPLGGP